MLKINGINAVQGHFPNGETDYKKMFDFFGTDPSTTYFELVFESNEDLFNLIVMKKMYDDSLYKTNQVVLDIDFFPYSQMDRAMPTHGFSLKYVAQIINDLKFDEVTIKDPHSNVTPALLNNCRVQYPVTAMFDGDADFEEYYDMVFYPDNGACKKYSEIIDFKKYRFGNKKRNLETGEIICYEVIADEEDIKGKRILIVDDICMGGRTFVEAAKALKEMGASKVGVYITHMMPQSKHFYETKGDGYLDEILTDDTLGLYKNKEVIEIELAEDMFIE